MIIFHFCQFKNPWTAGWLSLFVGLWFNGVSQLMAQTSAQYPRKKALTLMKNRLFSLKRRLWEQRRVIRGRLWRHNGDSNVCYLRDVESVQNTLMTGFFNLFHGFCNFINSIFFYIQIVNFENFKYYRSKCEI